MPKYCSGDRVIVPWGLDETSGTVTHVFGPSGAPFVMVRVDLVDADEDVQEAGVGFRASDVRPAPVVAK
jgi:rRNA processing protein Gar1